jgi:hypothetical protein
MVKKDEIYFLHIPKNGGHWVINEIIVPVKGNIKVLGTEGHRAWTPVKSETYVICTWREPSKRIISHYAFLVFQKEIPFSKFNVKDFFAWFETNKEFWTNYQSKNILFTGLSSDLCFRPNHNFFKDKDVDTKILYDRINSIEIFIKDNQMIESNVELIIDKICNDFEVKKETLTPNLNKFYNINSLSNKLYEQLNKKQIIYLQKTSYLDYEIYNNLSLFWNEGK